MLESLEELHKIATKQIHKNLKWVHINYEFLFVKNEFKYTVFNGFKVESNRNDLMFIRQKNLLTKEFSICAPRLGIITKCKNLLALK